MDFTGNCVARVWRVWTFRYFSSYELNNLLVLTRHNGHRQKSIWSISAVFETVTKKKNTYTAVTKPVAETVGPVLAVTVAEPKLWIEFADVQLIKLNKARNVM